MLVKLSRAKRLRLVAILLCVAALAVFAVSMKQFYTRKKGFTMLIPFGDRFYERTLPVVKRVPHRTEADSTGYDGQWYAQLAFDPLLRNPILARTLDTPEYRARRILFSWTAYLAAFGKREWILKTYSAQNVVSWILLAFLMIRWIPLTTPRNVLPWAGCLFGVGLIWSVMQALLEGPSMVVLALAVIAIEANRPLLSAFIVGLAGLGRESNLLSAGLMFNRLPRSVGDVLTIVKMIALAVLPYLAWTSYVKWVFPGFSYANPDSFARPFDGYIWRWNDVLGELRQSGWWSDGRFNLMGLISLTTQAIFLLVRPNVKSAWWRMAFPLCILMAFMSRLVWEGAPGSPVRLLLPMTFAFNVLLVNVRNRWFWPLAIAGNLPILNGLAMLQVPWLSEHF